jgi:hypothetical protein
MEMRRGGKGVSGGYAQLAGGCVLWTEVTEGFAHFMEDGWWDCARGGV